MWLFRQRFMPWYQTLSSIASQHVGTPWDRKLFCPHFSLTPVLSSFFSFLYRWSPTFFSSSSGPDHSMVFKCGAIMASHSAFIVSATPSPFSISWCEHAGSSTVPIWLHTSWKRSNREIFEWDRNSVCHRFSSSIHLCCILTHETITFRSYG